MCIIISVKKECFFFIAKNITIGTLDMRVPILYILYGSKAQKLSNKKGEKLQFDMSKFNNVYDKLNKLNEESDNERDEEFDNQHKKKVIV